MAAKKILATAILGSILGSLAIKLYPKRAQIIQAIADQSSDLSLKSQDIAQELFQRGLALANLRKRGSHELSWKSAIAGLLLGAGAAMLLAPKNGRETRKQIKAIYHRISGTTQKAFKDFSNGSFEVQGRAPFHDAETLYPLKKAKKTSKAPVREH